MELNEIQKISNLKLFESSESQCYIHNDIIYKVFNENIDIESRLDVINTFLENDISGCPKLYNFIYSDNKIVGYVMKYYKKAVPFSQNEKFEFIRKKCIELIDIDLMIKNEYNLCYFDFHYGNIFINDGKILLFDIDSCLKKLMKTNKFLINY